MSHKPKNGGPVLEGGPAPDFTLPMPGGEFLALQELRGKKILLVFLRQFA